MSDGRKEHRRKILAANAQESQAVVLREKLDQVDKQKKEAAAKQAAKDAALREAAQRKLAEDAAKAARARKVFVAGDARGNLPKLLTTVEAQVAKVGAFDMLLCVGSFLPEGDDDDSSGIVPYVSGEKKVPLEVYFIDAGAALVHSAPLGRKLAENLHFLGGYGVRDINGLRVAFLSGLYNPVAYAVDDVDFVGNFFTSRAVSELQKLVLEDRKQRGIDILLTCSWPAGLEEQVVDEAGMPPRPDDGSSWQTSCAGPLAELSHAIEPRYHLFGAADLFYQRPPFQVPRRQHMCRCIGLGRVGSAGKQRKWLHALSLAPMRHMKPDDLRQSPPNATASPFSAGEKRAASDPLEEPPAKRRALATQTDSELPERAVSALLAGDRAAYASLKGKLQDAVTACGSAMPSKAAPAAVEQDKASNSSAPIVAAHAPGQEPVEAAKPEILSPADQIRKEVAQTWLSRPPPQGVVRYTFDAQGPLGIRLSRDVPPWILEVRDGTLAAKKAPKVPVGGVVMAVNGYELSTKENAAAVSGLANRPVTLDIEWPIDQTMPTVSRA